MVMFTQGKRYEEVETKINFSRHTTAVFNWFSRKMFMLFIVDILPEIILGTKARLSRIASPLVILYNMSKVSSHDLDVYQ